MHVINSTTFRGGGGGEEGGGCSSRLSNFIYIRVGAYYTLVESVSYLSITLIVSDTHQSVVCLSVCQSVVVRI